MFLSAGFGGSLFASALTNAMAVVGNKGVHRLVYIWEHRSFAQVGCLTLTIGVESWWSSFNVNMGRHAGGSLCGLLAVRLCVFKPVFACVAASVLCCCSASVSVHELCVIGRFDD